MLKASWRMVCWRFISGSEWLPLRVRNLMLPFAGCFLLIRICFTNQQQYIQDARMATLCQTDIEAHLFFSIFTKDTENIFPFTPPPENRADDDKEAKSSHFYPAKSSVPKKWLIINASALSWFTIFLFLRKSTYTHTNILVICTRLWKMEISDPLGQNWAPALSDPKDPLERLVHNFFWGGSLMAFCTFQSLSHSYQVWRGSSPQQVTKADSQD